MTRYKGEKGRPLEERGDLEKESESDDYYLSSTCVCACVLGGAAERNSIPFRDGFRHAC